jgi:HEAT repeat protein
MILRKGRIEAPRAGRIGGALDGRSDDAPDNVPSDASGEAVDGTGAARLGSRLDVELPRPLGSSVGGYTLLEVIGASERAVVYKARRSQRLAALKLLCEGQSLDRELLLRFRRPGLGRAADIQHPNLAAVEDVGSCGELDFYARVLLRGDTLHAILRDLSERGAERAHLAALALSSGGLPRAGFFRGCASLFAELADGLAVAHAAGAVHGNIHPGNLIFSPSGRLVLCDFGGGPARQRAYVAPDRLRAAGGDRPHEAAASDDVYALGAALFQVVHRCPAHALEERLAAEREHLAAARARGLQRRTDGGGRLASNGLEIAAELGAVLSRAIASEPAWRYPSARDFADDLRRLVDLEATRAGRSVAGAGTEAETEAETETETEVETEAAGAGRGGWRKGVVAGAFLGVLAAAIWVALALHDRSERFRVLSIRHSGRAGSLERAIDGLESAFEAAMHDRSCDAAEALASARLHYQPRRDLEAIEARLRARDEDPLLADLEDPRAAVRADAIAAWRRELRQGRRGGAELLKMQARLFDSEAAVRIAAIEALADAGDDELLLAAYPIGAGEEPLAIDRPTFLALYRALGVCAARGGAAARRALDAIELRSLEALDEPVAGLDRPVETAVAPKLRIVDAVDAPAESFTAEWLRARSRIGDRSVLDHVERLAARPELFPELVGALERLGGPESVAALRLLLARRPLELGPDIVDALERMAETAALLALASEPFSIELRAFALERALRRAPIAIQDGAARLLSMHPDVEIRAKALEGLARLDYFSKRPRALIASLDDAMLRTRALEILAGRPLPDAVPALLELLEGSANDVRVWVARALASAKDPNILHPLARQLFETDLRLRRAVLEALRVLGDDRAVPLAVGILGPRYPGLEDFAREVLAASLDRRREEPQVLVLALQELFGLVGPIGESLGIGEFRRAIFLAPLGWRFDDFERRLPERVRKAARLAR